VVLFDANHKKWQRPNEGTHTNGHRRKQGGLSLRPDNCSELSEEHRKLCAFEQAHDQGIWRMELKRRSSVDENSIGVLLNELRKRSCS
jgi:hypothetical protein